MFSNSAIYYALIPSGASVTPSDVPMSGSQQLQANNDTQNNDIKSLNQPVPSLPDEYNPYSFNSTK